MKSVFLVKCSRATPLLNKLYRAGICAQKIEFSDGDLRFKVDHRQCGAVESLLQNEGREYRVGGFCGTRRALRRLLSRPFLVASVVLSVAALTFFENHVYDYTIRGNEYVNTETIAHVLQDNRLDGFSSKGSLDLSRIKREITALDGISFASVKVVGTRLQVEVKESLPAVDPEAPKYAPILSSHAAVVTKIVAESGTPRVSVGQTVSAGSLLIEPIYAFTEGGSPAPAKGEVWGVVTYSEEVVLSSVAVEPVRTGESCSLRTLTLFGKQIGADPTPPYERCEWVEKVVYEGIGVTVTERTYYRVEDRPVCHDFDLEGEAVSLDSARALLLQVPCAAKERGAIRVTQKRVDNLLIIVLYYSVEQRIDSLSLAP